MNNQTVLSKLEILAMISELETYLKNNPYCGGYCSEDNVTYPDWVYDDKYDTLCRLQEELSYLQDDEFCKIDMEEEWNDSMDTMMDEAWKELVMPRKEANDDLPF